MSPTPDSLRPGHVIGSWRIEGYAGRGSYGLVFRARNVGVPHAEPVALKLAAFPYEARFLREAEALSRFRHPSIPRLVHSGWWIASPRALYPYLVLEWIRGWPLYEWARVRQPTSRQVLQVLAQVAGALEVLHAGGCLHRDVKGDNIRAGPEGRAVLLDYGSCTWKGAPPLTETLMPPNTPEYRSPEALRFQWSPEPRQEAGYEARPADDMYALGVTGYRLVTHVYPPPGVEREELKQLVRAPPVRRQPPRELNGRVAPELAALIERMLAQEPEARGQAREVADAAEASVAKSLPGLDAPLLEPEPLRHEAGLAPVMVAPAPDAKAPAVEAVSEPVPVRTEPRAHAWKGLLRFAAAALVLAGASIWWRGTGPQGQLPEEESAEALVAEVAQAEAPEAGESDTGPTGLADGGVSTRVETLEEATPAQTVTEEMPKEPLPGQRRKPCRRGEVEIRGGCWVPLWSNLTPPCGDEVYEWNGGCYLPRFERARRVPTTQKPRQ